MAGRTIKQIEWSKETFPIYAAHPDYDSQIQRIRILNLLQSVRGVPGMVVVDVPFVGRVMATIEELNESFGDWIITEQFRDSADNDPFKPCRVRPSDNTGDEDRQESLALKEDSNGRD